MVTLIRIVAGAHQSKIFDPRTLAVKFCSCVCAVSSGMPVGPEGPMIHMGSMVGRNLPRIRSLTIFQRFRNPKDARDLITAGSAAGVSAAFGAPVGGECLLW